ncbi:MAG: glycosyltransferase [Candidatus Omnitrophica bacterium]|nr:glycosyltransferase [Candidatus Omnitrophota bacterium]
MTFLGDGPLKDDILIWARHRGLQDRVELPGAVPYREMPDHFQRAFVLVLPSFREGTPSVLLEALACGTPCIASNTGDIPAVVSHEQNGLLIRPGSAEDIAAAVVRLTLHPELYARLQANARLSVFPYLSQAGVDRLMELYRAAAPF